MISLTRLMARFRAPFATLSRKGRGEESVASASSCQAKIIRHRNSDQVLASRHRYSYIPNQLAREGCIPDAIRFAAASAVPARGLANRSRAALGPRPAGTTTGPRGAR
jgi:hypothetical protein